MRIVNPSFGLEESEASRGAGPKTVSTDWSKDPIAIMSNSKSNARELLEGVREKMKRRLPVQDQRGKACADGAVRRDRQKIQGRHRRSGRLRVMLVVEFP